MMSENILCGPCGYAENNKKAEKWCTVCEEGLCADCEKVHKSIKTSRNHRLISIEDFRQIQNITISLNCKDHDKRLELYCKTHDVAVCLGCVPSNHRTCSDVIPLDIAAENAKRSTALADLEDTLTRTLQNLEQIINDRESALENLDGQKQTIKNTIIETRARILKKLDDLEQKLLHALDTNHENFKSEANKLLNRMKNSKRDLNSLREQTSQLKSFASDVQLFLGTCQINEAVFKEKESVKEGIKSLQNFELYFQLHPSIKALMNEVDQLGKISIKKTTLSLPFKEAKVNQAQMQRRALDSNSINNVHLQLKIRFNVKHKGNPCGCTMLPNGNVLIADYSKMNVLLEYRENGKHIRDIPCSDAPFDMTVIDKVHIAVTYGKCSAGILNMKNNSEKILKLNSHGFGISNQNNKLVIVIVEGFVITDLSGKELKTLNVDCGTCLGTTKDRIYFTIRSDQTVHCISMLTGKEIWARKEKSLINPSGITVDAHQNVFVVDQDSNSLVVIQHDGKASRKLLSRTDGLVNPRALHYNKDKKVLLLCGDHGCDVYNLE